MATAAVLLRSLGVCMLLCLLAAAGFYLMAKLTEDISRHRRLMNAAAYRSQVYFDQREAFLHYLGDSIVVDDQEPPGRTADGLRRLPLDGTEGRAGRWLLLSARAERTLVELQADLLLIDAMGSHWLAGSDTDAGLDAAPTLEVLRQRAKASAGTGVVWIAMSNGDMAMAQPVQVGPRPSQWLVLLLDGPAAARVVNGQGVGGYALLDGQGRAAFASPALTGDSAAWRALKRRQDDGFGALWSRGIPRGVALVKGVGDDGWRLVYHVPPRLIVRDLISSLSMAALLLVLASAGLHQLRRRINSQLIQPAVQQHRRLMETLDFSTKVIELAPVGICVLRRGDRALLLSNQLLRDWLGTDPDSERSDWHAPWRSQAGEHGRALEFRTHEGRQLQVLHAPCRYQGDDVLLCVFNDISRHLQVQAALSAARQAADNANQAKSAFLATMSHEIRTPLYGMLGTLEMLGRTDLDARQSQYLRTIESSSSVLLQLISDVLDVSKIESGQLSLECAPFSPRELSESCLRGFAAAAAAKHLKAFVHVDPRLPTQLLGDADRIRQILGNLLNNAIKFTDHGRVVLRARLMQREGDACVVAWQVSDTGMGIPLEEHARLFEPFRQVPGASNAQGTGLGLSITDRLVRLMSGELQLVSEPGLGSSFTVLLPLPVGCAMEDGPTLLGEPPVHVLGPDRELVETVCGWLCRWGASAHPLQGDPALVDRDGAILLDCDPAIPATWRGPRVVATVEGSEQPLQSQDGSLHVTLHGMVSMAAAIACHQQRLAPDPQVPREASPLPLAMRVLAVEDNPINRVILAEQLRALGCEVMVAQDGMEALRCCQQQAIDLVVTDINMPLLDGHALVRRLRADGNHVPVIGATATATAEERDRCLASGMQGYLSKPIDIASLRTALAAACPGHDS
jgi:two-component system capsular synthesis sensor histidine kinase RcsC